MPSTVPGRVAEEAAPQPAEDEVSAHLAAYGEPDVVEVLLPDTSCVLRGKWIPGSSIRKIWKDGVAIPLSIFGLDIWGREVDATEIHLETGDKDGLCWPVPGTLKPVPWAPRPTAQVLITMHEPDGSARGAPWKLDPRQQLVRVVDRFTARGLIPCVAFELEFYLLKPSADPAAPPQPVFPATGEARQNMYSMSDLDTFAPVLHDMRAACVAQGLPADTVISEAAPGQFEINLYHRMDALGAADDAILLRRLIDGVARRHGLRATFMAKPLVDFAGNGMHVHVSVMEAGGGNLFARPDGVGDRALRHAAAGLLASMADSTLIFVPSYNGYRRLVPGSYAPTSVSWGYDNRSVAVRVPNGPPAARRLEHRIAGAEAHPHLVLAAILAGMLEGIEQAIEPPEALSGNAYEHEAPRLSPSMEAAVARFAGSPFIARTFGEDYRRIYAVMKREELAAFTRAMLPLEYETYL
ncbi:glutamine synthetase family protein [Xanthobacter autotrophicus DSM 431]|uniref:glutamine synthetase family protein n=1 Tax=Xanthobacter nonsaccharivorans TaxID=3119912 RepID=UPI0037276694